MRLSIDCHFLYDPRVDRLANLLKEHRTKTEGRLLRLWAYCYEQKNDVFTDQEICTSMFLNDDSELLANARLLVSVGLAIEMENNMYVVKGVKKRISFLLGQKQRGKLGGKKKQENKDLLANARKAAKNPSGTLANTIPIPIPIPSSLPTAIFKNTVLRTCQPEDGLPLPAAEIEKETELEKPKVDRTDYAGFVAAWNSNCGSLAKVTKVTESRKRKIKCRLHDVQDLSYWTGVVQKMAGSKFCQGGKWATFDWLCSNDTNHVKVFEGKYDNRTEDEDYFTRELRLIAEAEEREKQQQNGASAL